MEHVLAELARLAMVAERRSWDHGDTAAVQLTEALWDLHLWLRIRLDEEGERFAASEAPN